MIRTFHRKRTNYLLTGLTNEPAQGITVGFGKTFVSYSIRNTASVKGAGTKSVAFPHGRILKTSAGYETNYHIADYLGSIRAIVKPNAGNNGVQIIEQNDYYPFGQKHKNANLAASTTNRFLYNGKEKQTTGNLSFLDYGARMYDPTIARWTTTDPLTEKYYAYSSFNFNLGNPINLIDHNGLAPDWVRDLEKDQYVWMDRVTSANNTPEGFLYVGHEDKDIINDLKIASKYKTQNISTVGIGPMGGDNVGPFGSGIFSRTKLLASGYITIDVNVSSGKNEYISENNKEGKYFEGITITAHLGQQSIHPDRDYQTLGQGKLSVIHGKQLQEELLRQNKGDYYTLPGMKWSHASIYIPSSQIKSSKAISAATISIGVTNQNITYIRPIKMYWPLQTKEVFRPF